MVDPISITSLASGLIDIGIRLASKVKAFVDDFCDAPSDASTVWDELSSLCLILGDVERMLRDNLHLPFPPETVDNLRLLLDHTMKVFIEFEKFVDGFSSQGNGSPLSGGYQQGRWVGAEKHITHFREILETHKASLNISLQLGTLLATANIAQVVGEIQANTETTNAELVKLRSMCQKLLDRERVIAKDGYADSRESPDRSETSSAIVAYVESTELLAEELIAPTLRSPLVSQTDQPSTTATAREVEAPGLDLSTASAGHLHIPAGWETLGPACYNQHSASDKPLSADKSPTTDTAPPASVLPDPFSAWFNLDPKSEGPGPFRPPYFANPRPLADYQLVKAAGSGDRATLERLIMSGANVNSRSRNNQTALQEAVRNKHEAIVRILIDSGANVDARALGDATALQLAAQFGHNRIVRLLMDCGADVHASPGPSGTALDAAKSVSTRELILRHPMYGGNLRKNVGRRGAVGNALLRNTFRPLIQLVGCLCCRCLT